ncbi:restriction endonuclease FokI C-terminal domain-containing protein [Neobacillus drentensis]|uniref:restriction endonuclease FokI C-terminal domain-containing protein n=1 Tax=Neobacillus drentensis TaxID=220684 RepID=UPI002FFF8E15
MINNWHIPRNKRKLYPVVDILSLFTLQNLGDVWRQNLDRHLNFEEELERYGLKREGHRRDQRGGGARTYESWLYNLGLIFIDTKLNVIRTTLAGEALLSGQPPVPIITNQLMKLQYPSPYSTRKRVDIHYRFQVRPFRFLLQLLSDTRIKALNKEEIGRFVITEGENESNRCVEQVISRIQDYREHGDSILTESFDQSYTSSTTGVRSRKATLSYLEDIANTFINYLEYTQIITRGDKGVIYIKKEMEEQVSRILSDGSDLRSFNPNHPFGNEIFQRHFGLAPGGNRDNRNFGGQVVTDEMYRIRRIRSDFLHIAGLKPIVNTTISLIREIAENTGYTVNQVEEALESFRPDTFSAFETSYLNMAISGTELATEFEIATKDIFIQLGFDAAHVGSNALHPDILVNSPSGYSGIIDTKAYRAYSISNDHKNRMVKNYIPTFIEKSENLVFFMYIADGFGKNISDQIRKVSSESKINGCVLTAHNLVSILQKHMIKSIDHHKLHRLFTSNSRIELQDIEKL